MGDENNELLRVLLNISEEQLLSNSESHTMNPADLQIIIQSAVTGALAAQAAMFDEKLLAINSKISANNIGVPPVQRFEAVTINQSITCEEGLDVVKSLSEFHGKKDDNYVSWRQAAHTAYKIFEPYEGSSKHYQCVAIIRNKVKGLADGTLTGYGTALNFRAIIARLDFAYSDKRPVHLIEQELSTLRQGNWSVVEFYDEVEKRLTLLTNKTIMTYPDDISESLNKKYRQDALRVFISGLKRSLSDTLFASRPADLPSALALAEELEGNRDRYFFAANFGKNSDNDGQSRDLFKNKTVDNNYNNKPTPAKFRTSNPNYTPTPRHSAEPEPMEIGSGLTKFKNNSSRRQNVNNIEIENHEDEMERYECAAREALGECDDDNIHFLGVRPCSRI